MENVAKALKQAEVPVTKTTLTQCSFVTACWLSLCSYIRRNETVYISYPTEGYGKSLWPFLLVLGSRRNVCLHMHEYGSKNRYCRFLLRRFQRMSRIFFSNTEDFQRYLNDCSLTADSQQARKWRVIPTPSNIPVSSPAIAPNPAQIKVIHFGQIRPLKGLEKLLRAFDALRDDARLKILVMGGVPQGYERYALDLSRNFEALGVQVKLNLPPAALSEEFASAQIGVFAFPEGADERRGSLIAAMAHGVLCITTHSSRTPKNLKAATIGVELQSGEIDTTSLVQAVRNATASLTSEENQRRITLAKAAGAMASFGEIARQITSA